MQQNAINPDAICQQTMQAKLNVYQAKEQFETVLKMYNDQVMNLISLIGLLKNRIIELESELEKMRLSEAAAGRENALSGAQLSSKK